MARDSRPTTIAARAEHVAHRSGFTLDAQQNALITAVDQFLAQAPPTPRATHWWPRWLASTPKADTPCRAGFYIHGGVGRGKSMLLQCLVDVLDAKRVVRWHCHAFMRMVHQQMARHKGQRAPLALVAKALADRHQILALDEFLVNDIADAMILGELLTHLFEQGVWLFTTSNFAPDDLYQNALQSRRFQPTRAQIKASLHVFELDGGVDYRLQHLQDAGVFFYGLTAAAAHRQFTRYFQQLTNYTPQAQPITILGRPIDTLGQHSGVIWFDFAVLCQGQRSQNDYLDLACHHHTLMLSDVPVLEYGDALRRFIWLIDILYDHHVNTILSTATSLTGLVDANRSSAQFHSLAVEFARTQSRLVEMQSSSYLQQPHKTKI